MACLQASDVQWLLNHPADVLSGTTVLPGSQSPIDLKEQFVDAYRIGFRTVFLVGAGLSALAFVFAFALLPQLELSRPDDEKFKIAGKEKKEEKL